jgi:hypothetical protein
VRCRPARAGVDIADSTAVVITSHGGPEAETIRAAPGSPLASGTPTPGQLREQLRMLGPSAGSVDGEIAPTLRNLAIPEAQQRIFQSDAAACEEVSSGSAG